MKYMSGLNFMARESFNFKNKNKNKFHQYPIRRKFYDLYSIC